MPLIAPPAAPTPSDAPEVFDAKIYARLVWDATNVTALNELQADVAANQNTASEAAGVASAQATNSSTSASTATTQASIATTKAADAAQALVDVQALLDQFEDKYLGAKAADPTLDNDGNPLTDGAFYISTTSGYLRAYTVAGGWAQGISVVAGVSSLNLLTGAVTLKTINGGAITGAGDIVTGLTRVLVAGTAQAATAGNDYWATNVAATALTAPAAVDGAEFAFTPANGLLTNTIDFGAATVRGPAGTATGIVTLTLGLSMHVKYSSTLSKWVLL